MDDSVKPKAKMLLEKIREQICLWDLESGKEFLDMKPIYVSLKKKNDKLNFIKMRYFCSLKDTTKRRKNKV